jgi:hypothetical protein
MPKWSRTPPAAELRGNMDLVRTPTDGSIVAIVTSEDLIGTNTHFWGGRTVPCEPPSCPACDAGCPTRWHAYTAIFNPSSGTQQILELTAQASVAFCRYLDAHGSLRGCHFKAYRTGRARNSKIEVVTKPADLTKLVLPDPPDVMRVLATIWRIDPSAWTEDGARDHVSEFVARGTVNRLAERLAPPDDPPKPAATNGSKRK